MGASSYRTLDRVGADPVTEADAIVELMRRSTGLRRRLLLVTIAASFVGGTGGIAFYVAVAVEVYGRVAGLFFATFAILTFVALHRLSGSLARRFEARWIAELAGQYALDQGALKEAAAILE